MTFPRQMVVLIFSVKEKIAPEDTQNERKVIVVTLENIEDYPK
jgi:hypothetical protein